MVWPSMSLSLSRAFGRTHRWKDHTVGNVLRGAAVVSAAVVAFVVVPQIGDDYWFTAILIPVLILSLAGLGLNLLTGYAGQLSVGSAAFMGVGAYVAYNVQTRIPGMPLLVSFMAGGAAAAAFGVIAGLPSYRIKGFYLVVCTLAVQFFAEWTFSNFRWLSRGNSSGIVSVPPLVIAGHDFGTMAGRYLLTVGVVASLTVVARNLVQGELGRRWMAVRDMDTAAAIIGIPVLKTKLVAFGISSFYCGIAGALWGFTYLGTFDPRTWDLDRSFQIFFVIILGGMGNLVGSFLGAAFMLLLPLAMSRAAAACFGGAVDQGSIENYKKIVFGVLIVVFLVKEPRGLAQIGKTLLGRIRAWPLRRS
ncbi:MAG: branched-chain amino acid ABC transporter permease [Polyangiaceae bacterium]